MLLNPPYLVITPFEFVDFLLLSFNKIIKSWIKWSQFTNEDKQTDFTAQKKCSFPFLVNVNKSAVPC